MGLYTITGIGRDIAVTLYKRRAQTVALSRTQADLDSLEQEVRYISLVLVLLLLMMMVVMMSMTTTTMMMMMLLVLMMIMMMMICFFVAQCPSNWPVKLKDSRIREDDFKCCHTEIEVTD